MLKRSARFCRGFVSQRGMRPDVVVVVAPQGQLTAGISQAVEDLFVQAFIPQAAVEGLDVAILLRLARIDVMPLDLVVVRPLQDGLAGELGAIARREEGLLVGYGRLRSL